MSPAKRRPPHSVRVLHKWIDDHVKGTGGAVARAQRWISFMVIATILDGVRDENDDPVFVLKGGAAMELRLGLDARATKDYDVTFRDRTAGIVARLDEAVQRPHADFAITRTEPVAVGPHACSAPRPQAGVPGPLVADGPVRDREGEAGQEIDRVPAIPLDHFGLEGLDRVPCASVRYQMAQKLHACTGRENDRSRDLVDLLLLRGMLGADGLPRVREACVEIFELRVEHAWPPTVIVFDAWRESLLREAEELGFAIRDVDQAAAEVQDLVREIDRT
jgi:Nucleotidyl transferase AbiEii toxin, Type IV TA system